MRELDEEPRTVVEPADFVSALVKLRDSASARDARPT
jgi:hypothetical protein